MLDFEELDRKLHEAFKKDTKESLTKWLLDKRKNSHMKHIAKQLRGLANQIESSGQHHAPKTSALIHKHFGKIIGDAFDRNCREQFDQSNTDSMGGAFVWKEAREGHDFWAEINFLIENNLT